MKISHAPRIMRQVASALVFAAGCIPLASIADQPSYAQSAPSARAETIHGTIYQVTSRFTLTLEDDRGFIDNIALHNGTIITPVGLSLGSGQVATLTGHTDGKSFDVDDIDVDPASISSGQAVLPGGDYGAPYSYGAAYPAYAFGYDPGYVSPYGNVYFGQGAYYGGGYYAPTGYYPGYGSYGNGGSYVPPAQVQPSPSGVEPLPRRPVRVPIANPPAGYRYPTGGSRVGTGSIAPPPSRAATPIYRSAPVYRSAPAPAPRSVPPPAVRSAPAPPPAPPASVQTRATR